MIILKKAEDALIVTDVVNVDVVLVKNLHVNGARKKIRRNLAVYLVVVSELRTTDSKSGNLVVNKISC